MRALAIVLVIAPTLVAAADPVVIGSKNFTESYLLAEIAAQWLEGDGIAVRRRTGLGGTKISYDALVAGELTVYPEYTGTIAEAILDRPELRSIDDLNRALATLGLEAIAPLGFNNTYALAMRADVADTRAISTISDLARHPALRVALSHEFRQRRDGWKPLREAYQLPQNPVGIDHGLAYQALDDGRIDVTDAYSTDGDIVRYALRLLEDDRAHFPRYDAVWLIRSDAPREVHARLSELTGLIDDARMRRLNARAAVESESFAAIASDFLADLGPTGERAKHRYLRSDLWRNVRQHIALTVVALGLAVVAGVSIAFAAYSSRRLARIVLYVAGLFQTIPSIALLALMLPIFGIGYVPAVVALLLYALLPILRSTLTALSAVDPLHRKVAAALGMTRNEEFRFVLVPLALPHVLSGVRTASVISIGTATLAAFIGAGGLGQPIVTGLALNDTAMILEGAVPAALLAILTDVGFDLVERRFVPAHMRASRIAT